MKVRKVPRENLVSKEFVRVLGELDFAANQRLMMSTEGVPHFDFTKTPSLLKRWCRRIKKLRF